MRMSVLTDFESSKGSCEDWGDSKMLVSKAQGYMSLVPHSSLKKKKSGQGDDAGEGETGWSHEITG